MYVFDEIVSVEILNESAKITVNTWEIIKNNYN